MSKEFLDLLRRNYAEDDLIPFAVNKTFYNQKHPENVFARDFEQFHYKIKLIPSQVKALRDKYDLYICFTPCEGGDRKKVKAKDSFIIAQDIDGVSIPEDLPPSYYWETSPGKYQGVWVLDNKVTPQEQEIICKKLIKKYNFDPCGSEIGRASCRERV